MSLESVLRSICEGGRENDSIAEIRFSSLFNMRRVIATRETLRRICGFGEFPSGRFLDDLVSKYYILHVRRRFAKYVMKLALLLLLFSINHVSLVCLEGGKLHNVDSVIDASARVAECVVHGSSTSAII